MRTPHGRVSKRRHDQHQQETNLRTCWREFHISLLRLSAEYNYKEQIDTGKSMLYFNRCGCMNVSSHLQLNIKKLEINQNYIVN